MLLKESDFSRALYTFDIGQNDLTAGYKLNMSTEQVKAYVPDVLHQFSNVIKVRMNLQLQLSLLISILFSINSNPIISYVIVLYK